MVPKEMQSSHVTRSSVEGLNQEIERLVLHPTTGRANRQSINYFPSIENYDYDIYFSLDQVSALRGTTPDGTHLSPLLDNEEPSGSRSANSQTPIQDTELFAHLHHSHSDDSHESLSLADEEGAASSRSFARIGSAEASPRINKFLAQLPPEGCERIPLRAPVCEVVKPSSIIKPVAGFQLRPSLGSAFTKLAPSPSEPPQLEGSLVAEAVTKEAKDAE